MNNNKLKLSVSNIAWDKNEDLNMYNFLIDAGFTGIEIAPTRLVGENPYDKISEAKIVVRELNEKFGLEVSSMQSIWYGRNENIFSNKEERQFLTNYTKKAINFAAEINCKNIVFGCPKNRNISTNLNKENCYDIAKDFFYELGEYAKNNGTVIALEANPVIYNTNFINSTNEAIELVKKVSSDGFKINLDCGTIVQNGEDLEYIYANFDLFNHVHISEPYLKQITFNGVQTQIIDYCLTNKYQKYISIEMSNSNKIEDIKIAISELKNYIENTNLYKL